MAAQLAGRPTPVGNESNESPEQWADREKRMKDKNPNLGGLHKKLGVTSQQAGWGTPTAQDAKHANLSPAEAEREPANMRNQVHQAGWPTPNANEPSGELRIKQDRQRDPSKPGNYHQQLGRTVTQAGWPTPMAGTPAQNGNNEAGNNDSSRKTVELSMAEGPARLTASGQMLIGSDAAMESGGALNPALSRWLQAYPVAWCQAGIQAHRMLKNRRKGG